MRRYASHRRRFLPTGKKVAPSDAPTSWMAVRDAAPDTTCSMRLAGVARERCARAAARARCGASPSCTRCCSRGALRAGRRRGGAGRTCAHEELDDLATQAADDALVAILAQARHFRGASRFTTWAYKFALLEAGVKAPPARVAGPRDAARAEEAGRCSPSGGPRAQQTSSRPSCCARSATAMHDDADAHQREVFVALALNGVPIDVLAERLDTTRGALYKTLHDARRSSAPRSPSRVRLDARRRSDMSDRRYARLRRGCSAPAGPRSAARSASSCSTVRRARARRRATPTRRCPGMRAHLEGCPACREDHESLRELVADLDQ